MVIFPQLVITTVKLVENYLPNVENYDIIEHEKGSNSSCFRTLIVKSKMLKLEKKVNKL